ncbi:phage virion morphogenesis (putative tail completion) protein [Rhizobium sp. RU35A]|uniref:phage virion morphogenesis protein n=1 Tax=Rhizobium sp. RU35A TaxID=1907414 RepID=UPI0009540E76|nr:phage virion morphogenesis protein [Rhizobium sp. RU35A]SIQ24053.1 phage virion morphogenesis (putative tail completion) protein [Rhizobium sp. RU35A]
MSGVSISVTIEDRAVQDAFRALTVRMFGNTRPIMAAIGNELVASTHMRFVTQTDPQGNAWHALNTEYAKGKRNSRILTESGRLRDSINAQAGQDVVVVGTNVIYARPHQLGAEIKPVSASHLFFKINGSPVIADSVTLPARPFLGISADDETSIAEIVFSFVERYTPNRP